ncbi:MBL fold metallo-hydrolase [Solimonas marina]|uniref:MBL fold metallo-hydrolase n=1 Tax=Solimonas marina TaxID=2714601 RepID=A0A969W7J6_9GAMM|nr:MBL fold metallo-hydrolase [Solimonas marina]NKF20959.1 MBL fold metallo-hydrolase [Solimonas marina]
MSSLRYATLAPLALSLIALTGNAQAAGNGSVADGYVRIKLGGFTVIALSDGTMQMPAGKLLIPDPAHPDEVRDLLGKAFDGTVPTSDNAFLIDTGSQRVLIDAGGGQNLGPGMGQVVTHLRAAGYTPEQIDRVLITHLHPDHVGGIVHDGKAVFPNAVIGMSADEAAAWTTPQAAANPQTKDVAAKAIAALAPYRATGHIETFKSGATIVPGITAEERAGHTPGHTTYRVQSGGKTLLAWGDVVHVAAVQFPDPKVTIHYDSVPAEAEAARAALFAQASTDGEWIAAAHIAFPGIGHIAAGHDGAYVWQALKP